MQLFVLFSLLLASNAFVVEAQAPDLCGNTYTYPSLISAYNEIDRFIYQERKFNPTCMQESCSKLVNPDLCPTNSDKSFNVDAIRQSLTVLQTYFQEGKPICGHPIESIPLPNISSFLFMQTEFFPFNSSFCTKKAAVKLYGLSSAEFSLNQDLTNSNEVGISIYIPEMAFKGHLNSQLVFTPTSFLNIGKLFNLKHDFLAFHFNLTDLPLDGEVSAEVKLQLALDPPSFQLNSAELIPAFNILFFKIPKEIRQFPIIKTIASALGGAVITSSCSISLGNFLGTFFTVAFQVLNKNCASTPA